MVKRTGRGGGALPPGQTVVRKAGCCWNDSLADDARQSRQFGGTAKFEFALNRRVRNFANLDRSDRYVRDTINEAINHIAVA